MEFMWIMHIIVLFKNLVGSILYGLRMNNAYNVSIKNLVGPTSYVIYVNIV